MYLDNYNYYNDHRVKARRHKWYESFDDENMTVMVVFVDDCEPWQYDLPVVYEVCNTCNGKGKHVDPSIDASGLIHADMDPDFEEQYFNGVYDVACYGCDGKRVVPVPSPQTDTDKEVVKYIEEVEDDNARYDAIVASEILYGC